MDTGIEIKTSGSASFSLRAMDSLESIIELVKQICFPGEDPR
jgi:hypothetical protein